jgi:hypothetical protein
VSDREVRLPPLDGPVGEPTQQIDMDAEVGFLAL